MSAFFSKRLLIPVAKVFNHEHKAHTTEVDSHTDTHLKLKSVQTSTYTHDRELCTEIGAIKDFQ